MGAEAGPRVSGLIQSPKAAAAHPQWLAVTARDMPGGEAHQPIFWLLAAREQDNELLSACPENAL
jgi:hypothetical protein